jgi:hypothetical protein
MECILTMERLVVLIFGVYDCTKGLGGIYPTDKKIILTTDPDLIKDGVQAIDDEFLEWFVKNNSCEGVEVKRNYLGSKCLKCGFIENHDEVDTENCPKCSNTRYEHLYLHKIIIPQEKPNYNMKQEILDEMKRLEKEEPKQLTDLEIAIKEAAEIYWKMQYLMALDESTKPYIIQDFTAGAKWQAERMYSEKELLEFGKLVLDTFHSEGKTKSGKDRLARIKYDNWFEQFKKQNNEQ